MVTYETLERIISKPRLGKFLAAGDGNQEKAIRLYFASTNISGDCFKMISLFEVLLRNRVDRFLFNRFREHSPEWLIWLSQPGSILEQSSSKYVDKTLSILTSTIKDLESKPNARLPINNHKLLSELSFGFWTALFKYEDNYEVLGGDLADIFVNFTKNNPRTRRKEMAQNLQYINGQRNRIAHNESIIFTPDSKVASMAGIEKLMEVIEQMTQYLGEDPNIYSEFVKPIREDLSLL